MMRNPCIVIIFIFFFSISYSQPLRLKSRDRNISLARIGLRRNYTDSTEIVSSLPEQPKRAARIELSLILENLGVTAALNNILVGCMASNTDTNVTSWGVYGVDRFTPSQVQIEYFCIVAESKSLQFPEVLDTYISSGNLLFCLRKADEGISADANIISGRTVAAPRSGSIISATGSTPGWIAGVLLAVIGAIGALALLAVLLKGEEVYLESEFTDFASDSSGDEDLEDSRDGEMMVVEDRDGRELKQIPKDREVIEEPKAVADDKNHEKE